MSLAFVPYLNAAITNFEGILNCLGYLPKHQFSRVNTFSTKFRIQFGTLQTISGIALTAIGLLIDYTSKNSGQVVKSFTFGQQVFNFGLAHANHGIFNIARAFVERQGFGCLTGAYDFYGRKFIPSLSPGYDFSARFFEIIRDQLDRVHFVTLFPPKFLIK